MRVRGAVVNRLSEYIKGMTMTRELLKEAKIRHMDGQDSRAMLYMIQAFDAFVSATSCAVAIREGKRPKAGRS